MSAPDEAIPPEMDRMLDDIRRGIAGSDPGLLAAFELYREEARFGRMLIGPELRRLQPGARILEIGAGSLMLSCALQREGYQVTALEPIGRGFSHFAGLQQAVLDHARQDGVMPAVIRCSAEALDIGDRFEFAFSVNVMEHVDDVSRVLAAAYRALKAGGVYRFICPNYAFPYEPHFNLPTLFSRSLTEMVFRRRILSSRTIADPDAVWSSLNWITVAQVRRICRRELSVKPVFRGDIFEFFLDRALSDASFQSRRGLLITKFIGRLRRLGLLRLTRLIPVAFLPVMDCAIMRAREA